MSKYDTDITVVLDRSGSMNTIRDDTIGGFNSFLKDQQAEEGSARLSLVLFDHEYEDVYTGVPVGDVKPLDEYSFVPRGQTALLDAMGRTIANTGARLAALPEDERPDNVVFVVITDGHENDSKEFGRDDVFEAVSHQTDKYNWTFLYLGANQDAIAVGQSMGVSVNNSLSYNISTHGTRHSHSVASKAVSTLRKTGDFRGFASDDRSDSMK